MAKRLTKQEKQEKAVVDLINEMFQIAGHDVTYDDIKDRKDNWFHDWTMTMEENDKWQQWGKTYLQKNLKLPARLAEREMQWMSLMWGLKFSDFPVNK
jgi:hypothetical protein